MVGGVTLEAASEASSRPRDCRRDRALRQRGAASGSPRDLAVAPTCEHALCVTSANRDHCCCVRLRRDVDAARHAGAVPPVVAGTAAFLRAFGGRRAAARARRHRASLRATRRRNGCCAGSSAAATSPTSSSAAAPTASGSSAERLRPEMRRPGCSGTRDQGHEIAIVSASLDVYLDRVGRAARRSPTVLCSRLEVDAHGRVDRHARRRQLPRRRQARPHPRALRRRRLRAVGLRRQRGRRRDARRGRPPGADPPPHRPPPPPHPLTALLPTDRDR